MPYIRTNVQLDKEEAKAAVEKAKKKDPDMNLSRLIRNLIRIFNAGKVRL